MYVAYDLRDDKLAIEQLQLEECRSAPVGLAQVLKSLAASILGRGARRAVGSDHWWEQIETGSLPVHSVIGTVSGYWPGQWAAGPAEFELKESDGARSMWLCGLEPPNATFAFRVGRSVEVRYVLHEFETRRGRRESKVVISILLGDEGDAQQHVGASTGVVFTNMDCRLLPRPE